MMNWKMALSLAALVAAPLAAQDTNDSDARADALVRQMTLAEKIQLLHGNYPNKMNPRPDGVPMSAGWVPGIERLDIPAQRMSDASLGVAAAHQDVNPATALPSGLALAATFDPRVAYAGGATIGAEARAKGFNVLLAGGANLVREPRNGRNFEYLGEDPLLAGIIGGESIRGIQSNHIVSTAKHFALNAQETGRQVLDARIGEAALRESDLLAFQKEIEIGDPGAVMCAYNRLNGDYACENKALLSILRDDWGFKGWVMSDWGAVHSTVKAAKAGLDQEMGEELDPHVWYGRMLADAVTSGALSESEIDAKARHILRSYLAHGVIDDPVKQGGAPDLAAGAKVTQDAAAKGIVLLKNMRGVLPLAAHAKRIAVIGGAADLGVYSGGGSSQVKPAGIRSLPPPTVKPSFIDAIYLHPSSPLAAIRAAAPKANVNFTDGKDIAAAVAAAKSADVVVVFAAQYATEGMDAALALDGNQDALIAAVAAANPNTVVVLETGGPLLMPWLDRVPAVLEAWYPGGRGGEAIAGVLFGTVNPQGRLPVTFPASVAQLPNAEIPGSRLPRADTVGSSQPEPFEASYPEGADVGYRWYAKKAETPLFPFGFGLSYTSFAEDLVTIDPTNLTATLKVTNTGKRAGTDTPQLYVNPPGEAPRLVGWAKASLPPGKSGIYNLTIDPRFAARFDVESKQWVLPAGNYTVRVASSAADPGTARTVELREQHFPLDWHPQASLAPVALAE